MNPLKILVIVGVSLCFSSGAFGSFTGHWEGKGVAKGTGWETECTRISYHFDESPTALKLVKGEIQCGQIVSAFEAVTLPIRNHKLYYEELEIGTISEDAIHIAYADSNVSLKYDFVKKEQMDGETQKTFIDYHQSQSSADGTVTVEGRLLEIQ